MSTVNHSLIPETFCFHVLHKNSRSNNVSVQPASLLECDADLGFFLNHGVYIFGRLVFSESLCERNIEEFPKKSTSSLSHPLFPSLFRPHRISYCDIEQRQEMGHQMHPKTRVIVNCVKTYRKIFFGLSTIQSIRVKIFTNTRVATGSSHTSSQTLVLKTELSSSISKKSTAK